MIIAFSFIGLRFNAPRWRSRLTDEERDSSDGGEKAVGEAPEYDELASPDGVDRKDLHLATGAAFDPDLKAAPAPSSTEPDQQTRFDLPRERKRSLAPSTFSVTLPKRDGGAHSLAAEKRPERASMDEEEDGTVDDGEFGVGAAKVSLWGVSKILLAGIVCGGGIAAMHYIGQVSINSVPRVTNSWYTVFLSVIIAMFCVTVGLYILFVIFRPKLQHSWYKRILVAGILAVGVTLMHFVALLGTHYWAIQGEDLRTGSDHGTKVVIIAIICVVAPICCILLLVFAYFGQQRVLHQKASRHRIMLSTAIFDQHGLLLVHPDSGLLPSAKIYPSRTNEPEKFSLWQVITSGNRLRLDANKVKLQRSDPTFVAFLKLSWTWRTQKPSADAAAGAAGDEATSTFGGVGTVSRPGDEVDAGRLSEADDEMTGSEAEGLRRSVLSFEMAGEEIASELTGTPNLKALGVLYDAILKIGHFQVSSKSAGEAFTVTQGQMLVLARRLRNNAERDALVARGYVFAEPSAVARVTSSAYAVPNERVLEYFRSVYRFTRTGVVKRLDRGRLYGGLLMLQALPGEGLHVVVDERQHHSLPMTDLASLVDPWQDPARFAGSSLPVTTLDRVVDALEQLGGQTLLDLVNTSDAPGAAAELRALVVQTLRPYLERVLTSTTLDSLLPRLHVAPTLIPLTARTGPTYGADGVAKDSYLVCLKAVIPSSITFPSVRLDWLPFPLYQAQSECVTRASGAAATSGRRPQTGGSTTEAARFGSSGRCEGSGGGAPRTSSAADWSTDQGGDHPLFATSTAAPFSTGPAQPAAWPRGTARSAGAHGSATSTASATGEDDGESDIVPAASTSTSSRPATGINAGADLPPGVPEYSPDWILGLIRTATAPGHHAYHWDVPPPARRGGSAARRGA
ncbi:hypothetical protein DMC30DRAFT_6168 [Rhodotorula diobovata]|uniref:MHYT domain-containing protein n=1 Tax=Rhodotorula diobovata TaxID=5288 RepID=A0A5C5G8J2_9BASI|nr:hypothetical protein DMC30DRAFT_6168 [Rhodotorula diobovata]